MSKRLLRTLLLGALLATVLSGAAAAIVLRAGNIVVVADGGFSPTRLPRTHDAPIRLHGYGKIRTADGSLPPVLKSIVIWFDKHGSVETRGLPTCSIGRLQATTTKVARKLCPGAIVGRGYGEAVVKFPEQGPIPAGSAITIFNGPRKHGNPTVLAHAHLVVPAPTTFVVPIEIQRVHDGRYGFKTVAEIPKIAGGYGIPTYGRLEIGRTWEVHGKSYSYANARCADGRLEAKGELAFEDGTHLEGTVFKPCQFAR